MALICMRRERREFSTGEEKKIFFKLTGNNGEVCSKTVQKGVCQDEWFISIFLYVGNEMSGFWKGIWHAASDY